MLFPLSHQKRKIVANKICKVVILTTGKRFLKATIRRVQCINISGAITKRFSIPLFAFRGNAIMHLMTNFELTYAIEEGSGCHTQLG